MSVPGEAGVLSLAAGGGHTCVVEGSGSVSCWGRDDFGQLGDGATANQGAPAPVTLSSNESVLATAIAAGASHTCALTSDGRIFCWGRADRQQLGGEEMTSLPPSLVVGPPAAIAIASGGDHSCALAGDGHVCAGAPTTSASSVQGPGNAEQRTGRGRGFEQRHRDRRRSEPQLCATHRRLGLVLGWQPERSARRWRRLTDGAHPSSIASALPLTTPDGDRAERDGLRRRPDPDVGQFPAVAG